MRRLRAEAPENAKCTEITRLRQRLKRWRQGRKRGERLPERLWQAAVKMAERHGLAPTARLLKVDYYSLKRRLEEEPSKPRFIELGQLGSLASAPEESEWSIEVEERRGVKLRVQYKGPQAPDLGLLRSRDWGVGK